jgi:ribosomal-protein-alanine N-acetyltransferase
MALPGVFGLLALAQGVPVGFALGQVVLEEAELLTLGVLPEARRRGHGRRLLQAVCAGAARRGAGRITLEVAETNRDAQRLYRGAGFLAAGRRRKYYRSVGGNCADALILARPLEDMGGAESRSRSDGIAPGDPSTV